MEFETWIPVAERLPDSGASYVDVRYTVCGREKKSRAYYSGRGNVWCTGEWATYLTSVTHWLEVRIVGRTPIDAIKIKRDANGETFVRVKRGKHYQVNYPKYGEHITPSSLERCRRARVALKAGKE
jgi:hypothetical protein